MPSGFSVHRRNPGHWDIYQGQDRSFRIRGEPGNVLVLDERSRPPPEPRVFRTVIVALAVIAEELMQEI